MQRRKPMSPKHQARRARALERFSIDEKLAKIHEGYKARKEAELAALQLALNRTS